jgi:thiol-disulfide isomerase/thioredoxin
MASLRAATLGAVLCLVVFACVRGEDGKPTAKPEPLHRLTVRVLDVEGKPLAGAHVGIDSHFWSKNLKREAADADGFMYRLHCVSDAKGLARMESAADDFRQIPRGFYVVARHDGRHLMAIVQVDLSASKPFDVRLVPECRVTGKLACAEFAKRSRKLDWTNVYLSLGKKRLMWCVSEDEGEFHFFLPPGTYKLDAYGTYLKNTYQTITVPAGKRELAVNMAVPATRFALLQGRPAPELSHVVAWKNCPPLKLSDLKGKCVLVDFWGYWCNPCVHEMPWLFRLHDRFAQEGLVVIGIHVDESKTGPWVESVPKLDEKLVTIRKDLWNGRDIPFPVALVRHERPCPVVEGYGINGYPTCLLIDRRGNIVDVVSDDNEGLALVEKCLADKPGPAPPGGDAH